jgi:hypothetical protein
MVIKIRIVAIFWYCMGRAQGPFWGAENVLNIDPDGDYLGIHIIIKMY